MPLPPMNDTQYMDERCGLVYPWFSKPMLDVLSTWDLKDKRVFEYGGGHSTVWWSRHAKEVVTVECDLFWIFAIEEELRAADFFKEVHNSLLHRAVIPNEVELKSKYVNAIYEEPGEFDIIVVDGSYRDECVAAALTKIKDGGIIICDNYQQDYVWDAIMGSRLLDPWKANIFVQPDHTNHEGRPWKTGYWVIHMPIEPNDVFIDGGKITLVDLAVRHFLFVTDAYNSHRPMLWMALEHIKPGLVVEFGCGYGSTPLLERYCGMQERRFLSFETESAWCNRFDDTAGVGNYLNMDIELVGGYGGPISIVFIDSAPGEQRADLLRKWANATVLIVHDTEPEAEYVYHIQEALNSFKYRCDLIIDGYPQTTAVSNVYDFERWKGVTLGKYRFV